MTMARVLRLQNWPSQGLALLGFCLVAFLPVVYVAALWITIPIPSTSTAEAERILGHALPNSADDVRTLRRQTWIDGYKGYIRYTMMPDDLSALAEPDAVREIKISKTNEIKASPYFPPTDHNYRLIERHAPRWWQVPEQDELITQFHSFGVDGPPHVVWHIIDCSDASQCTVYAYAIDH